MDTDIVGDRKHSFPVQCDMVSDGAERGGELDQQYEVQSITTLWRTLSEIKRDGALSDA